MSYALRRISAATRDSQGTSRVYYHALGNRSTLIARLRLSYGQFMSLFSKTVAERTKPGQRQDVEEKCNAHLTPIAPIAISLPIRVSADMPFHPIHSMPMVAQKASQES